MKAKSQEDKELIKLKFAVAFNQLYENSGYKSLREFASVAGLESAHVQRLAAGKVDAALTTIISLAEGLAIPFAEFAKRFENVNDSDVKLFVEKREKSKRSRL